MKDFLMWKYTVHSFKLLLVPQFLCYKPMQYPNSKIYETEQNKKEKKKRKERKGKVKRRGSLTLVKICIIFKISHLYAVIERMRENKVLQGMSSLPLV